MHVCGAKTRNGSICKNAGMLNGRCRMHGGTQPRGADSPQLKHGRYSKYLKQSLHDKLGTVQDENPLDLLPELDMQRLLFAEYLGRFQSGGNPSAFDIQYMMNWLNDVGRTVERIVKMKNDTALTNAEVQFLAMRVVELIGKYVEPDKQHAFIAEFTASIPALIAGDVG